MASRITTLIKHFGTQVLTAKALGVSQATVSYWLSGAVRISPEKAFLAEMLTNGAVSASSLCPLLAQVEARHKVGKSCTTRRTNASGADGSVQVSSTSKACS